MIVINKKSYALKCLYIQSFPLNIFSLLWPNPIIFSFRISSSYDNSKINVPNCMRSLLSVLYSKHKNLLSLNPPLTISAWASSVFLTLFPFYIAISFINFNWRGLLNIFFFKFFWIRFKRWAKRFHYNNKQ